MPEGCPDRWKVVQFILHGFEFSKILVAVQKPRSPAGRNTHAARRGPMVAIVHRTRVRASGIAKVWLANQPRLLWLANKPSRRLHTITTLVI
eukprot:734777-Prymnesium_polylepis.1